MAPRDPIVQIKAMDFAARIVKVHEYLVKEKKEKRISDQLDRSGTSVQANIAEAQYAVSRPDFINKMQIALKEANESRNWITLLFKAGYFDERSYLSLYDDINQIVMLLIAILRTSKDNGQS